MIKRQRCCKIQPLTHSTLTIQPTAAFPARTHRPRRLFIRPYCYRLERNVACSSGRTGGGKWHQTFVDENQVRCGAGSLGGGRCHRWERVGVLPSFPLLSFLRSLWRARCIVLHIIHSSFISLSHPVDHHPVRFPSADGPLGNRPCPNTPWLTVSPTAVLHSLPTNLSDRWAPHDQTHRRTDTSVTPGDRVRKTGGTTITRDTRKRRSGCGVRKVGGANRRGNVRCICLSGNES